MQLLSLSASSGQAYEDCPAQWKALFERKYSAPGGSAAELGSAVHEAFEQWIVKGHYKRWPTDCPEAQTKMIELVDAAYYARFASSDRLDEARKLALKWLARQDWTGRTVVSTETKQSFPLATSFGPIPFNYIFDRLDIMDDGDTVEIVDYKSMVMPVQPADLKHRIQARGYALAARLMYPDAKRIWVTFDLLRYESVSIAFTAQECDETLAYLGTLAERIIADNDPQPKLNDKCRWCPIKWDCQAIKSYVDATHDPLAFGEIGDLAAERAKLKIAAGVIDTMLSDVDAVLLGHLGAHGQNEVTETAQDGREWKFGMATQRRRVAPDIQDVAPIIGTTLAIEIAGNPSIKDLEDLIASGDLNGDQINAVRKLMVYRNTAPSMKVTEVKQS